MLIVVNKEFNGEDEEFLRSKIRQKIGKVLKIKNNAGHF